jgi:hypothetical protein
MASRPQWRLARDRALAAARREALNKLADLHPAEYIVLVGAECAAMGVEAPWVRPGGRPSSGDV